MKVTHIAKYVGILALTACTSLSFAAGATKQDAMAMVKKAIAMQKQKGDDAVISAINTKDPSLVQGELYVSASDTTGTMVAFPFNPKIIGKNNIDVPDQDGNYYRKTIVDTANSKGSGWVDFKYKNPETNKVDEKTAYFEKSGKLIFVSGVYKRVQ